MTEKLFLDQPTLKSFEASITEVLENGVVLNQTAFYANSGGQPGDYGMLNTVPVIDTLKSKENPDDIIHVIAPENLAQFEVGQNVTGNIDWERRAAHMRMHTALHLMCAIVDGSVTGGSIGAEKSRLDFAVEAGTLDKDNITEKLNAFIDGDHAITSAWVDEEELDRNPDLVRTLSVKPPRGSGKIRMITIGDITVPVDRQPCGGTHVAKTSEIGRLRVSKIENKGKMNKRISIVFDDVNEESVAA